MLRRIDSLFMQDNASISKIEVKVIKGVDVEKLKFPTASFVSTGFCVVLLYTNDGFLGVGEPSPYGGSIESTISAITKVNHELTGKSLYDAWVHGSEDVALFSVGYGGLAQQAVHAALSQCCIDILSQKLSIPAYKIFDPDSDGVVASYASGGMIYDDQSLDYYVEEALEIKRRGFAAWKFRPATPKGVDHFQRNNEPPPIDVNAIKWTIKSVDEVCGSGFEILLDIGCRCSSLEQAKEICLFSDDYNVGFVEEPLPRKIDLYADLITQSSVRVSTGETFFSSVQFEEWAKNNAIDVFQPDINLVGFREGIKILSVARKYNKIVVFHNWANSISNIANICMAVSSKELCKYVESSIVYNPFREGLVDDPIVPCSGVLKLTNKIGLGVNLK